MRVQLANSFINATLILSAALGSISGVNAQQLSISGSPNHPRQTEVIEVPLVEARNYIADLDQRTAEDATTHELLPTQISEDRVLIAMHLPASGKLSIDFVKKDSSRPQDPQVFGREAPERKDDFAWENKYVAYRVYGPALEATGEITSGIDVWSKRVPNFVINSFYKHDAEGTRTHNPALSYHKDDGVGLDSYFVATISYGFQRTIPISNKSPMARFASSSN